MQEQLLSTWPQAPEHRDGVLLLEALQSGLDASPPAERLKGLLGEKYFRGFLFFIAYHSPYLSELTQRHWEWLVRFCGEDAATLLEELLRFPEISSVEETKKMLRIAKQRVALLTALGDITGRLSLTQVTGFLSGFAELSIRHALASLLQEAHHKKQLSSARQEHSGIVILGMGKLGGRELNYSSDIDLIILYEAEKLPFTGGLSRQHFMTRLAQDLVTILHDRTADGYVFRTDLRLRPDPASTPPAITTEAAVRYYETVGQNWERSAMIKARVVAGDIVSGTKFLQAIQPFIWRRHLDFTAINDILAIKRQMHAPLQGRVIPLPGHNIKTGHGGIREIEFFAHIYQLIWGGRMPSLRLIPTLETLNTLVREELLTEKKREALAIAYEFLRMLEHRLQMVADQQTHSLPVEKHAYDKIAGFCGFENVTAFEETLRGHLTRVNEIYSQAFQDSKPLEVEGNLVFTGVEHDADTLKTLQKMGYGNPVTVSEKIMDWHKGGRRSTRTQRARELLTDLVPALLRAFAESPEPDTAFHRFDDFLSRLPSGVQLFSLYSSRPELISLTAEIFGFSPPLAETLGHNPQLFDAVILGGFYNPLLSGQELAAELDSWLEFARNEEEFLQRLHTFTSEKKFQAGVHLLKQLSGPLEAGRFLSDVADVGVRKILEMTSAGFASQHGTIPNSELHVIALGKWGCHEFTLLSDLDLIFVYDIASGECSSDGEKPLDASVYFSRLAQRVIGTLTALTREGRLYEVDTRLRPFGKDGPLVVTVDAFDKYYEESAWLVEKIALVRARIVTGPHSPAAKKLRRVIDAHLKKPYHAEDIRTAITDIRQKITEHYRTENPWDVKYVKGGLMDLEYFILRLVLQHAGNLPSILQETTEGVLESLHREHVLSEEKVRALFSAHRLLFTIHSYVRLLAGKELTEEQTSPALKQLLSQATGAQDFATLKQQLVETQAMILELSH